MLFTITTKFAEKKTDVWKTLTFPDGIYDYKRINTFLQQHTGKIDPTKEDSSCIFNLFFDLSIYKVVILIQNGYELDLSQGKFAELIGYDKSF